ncbi:type II toxin-antitoxin system RelE/ParE family toxin [Candidatus Micrarchaeota archaeon]|nr:type II toxin-antitoxin system RelE/ParE family toxin [Candidatus Micrarchaeota archaeon]
MTLWSILISESARKDFYNLDNQTQKRFKNAFEQLTKDPYQSRSGADIKKLEGSFDPPLYRVRVGDYRAIYHIGTSEVKITSILHRSKGYKWLD